MRIFLPLFVTLTLSSACRAGENWPQFRGPHGDGRSDSMGLPLTWGEKENVVWKTPIHDKGWSSPVVWGGQVWMTTARADGTKMYAVCVDRATGKVTHDVNVFDVEKPAFCIEFNSYASPTPCVEEGRVYVHFGTYGTACLDARTGKTLWERRDLPCDHHRGPGSSPILFGDLLIFHMDGFDVQYVVALKQATGETAWKKTRNIDYKTTNGDLKKAYGTPAIITVEGRPQLVSTASTATLAYDPLTGEELWKVYHGGMNAAAPPLFGHGKVFLNTGDGGLKLLAARPDGRGDVTKTHIDWSTDKAVPSRCAPVLADDLLVMNNEGGIVTCLEAKTGAKVWQERLAGKFTASPVLAEGRLYYFSEGGPSYVVEAGRVWKKLASNKLDDGCMASPAVAGKALFVRTKTHLYRIEEKN